MPLSSESKAHHSYRVPLTDLPPDNDVCLYLANRTGYVMSGFFGQAIPSNLLLGETAR